VPIGGLAIKRLLGRTQLAGTVGERFERGDAAVIPLPHPSGVSLWLNSIENRGLVAKAAALIRSELASSDVEGRG
jgi:uracil-DNA glycosylase